MISNIIATLFSVVGICMLVFGEKFGFEPNPFFYIKCFVALTAGVGMLIYNNISYIKGLLKTKPKTESKIFLPEDYEVKDFEAITHLRDRCVQAGSDEGQKACAELAAILFQLDTPKKV